MTERIARLGAAAKRYLDLANAATDPKEAAEHMRQYEEKERTISDLAKEAADTRKHLDLVAAIRGWQRVADEAYTRACARVFDGRGAGREKIDDIRSETENARQAEAKAVALQASRTLPPTYEAEVAGSINALRERIRKLEALDKEFLERVAVAESRPR